MHTPSAGGVVVHDGKILVIASPRRNLLDLPKGTIEPNESIEDAAVREVEEETGYRCVIKEDLGSITYDFDGSDGTRYRKTVSYFLMELADENEPLKNLQPGEDFENEWLTPVEADARLTHEAAKRLVARVAERI